MSPRDLTAIDALTLLLQPFADLDGAIDRGAFFIAGDQEGDAAAVPRVPGREFFAGHHHGGQRGLHVGGAAAIEEAAAVRGHERRAAPLVERAGGHHVGMPGKDQGRAAGGVAMAALDRPQIGHRGIGRSIGQRGALETDGSEALGHQGLAAAVKRGDGIPGDQRLDEAQGVGHGRKT